MIGDVSQNKLGFIKVSLYSLSQGTCGVPKKQICVLFIRRQKLIIKRSKEASHARRLDFLLPTTVSCLLSSFLNVDSSTF